MTKYRFDISQAGYQTIRIEADKGLFGDNSNDLSAPSRLIIPNGGFDIRASETIFISGGNTNFRLLGKPFDGKVGDTGDAVLEMFENNCTNLGWTWMSISRT
jgi:hypothetical protein